MEELQCALHEAELATALEECSHCCWSCVAIVVGVVPTEKISTKLGPTVTIPATVNEVKVDVLVDTRSPVTILSFQFTMVVL